MFSCFCLLIFHFSLSNDLTSCQFNIFVHFMLILSSLSFFRETCGFLSAYCLQVVLFPIFTHRKLRRKRWNEKYTEYFFYKVHYWVYAMNSGSTILFDLIVHISLFTCIDIDYSCMVNGVCITPIQTKFDFGLYFCVLTLAFGTVWYIRIG